MEELRRTAGLVRLCLDNRLQRLRLEILDTTTSNQSNIGDDSPLRNTSCSARCRAILML